MKQIKVVKTSDLTDFEKQVNTLLHNGWSLHGDPQFQIINAQRWKNTTYVQALIKETEEIEGDCLLV